MSSKIASCFAVMTMFTVATSLTVKAQAPTAPISIVGQAQNVTFTNNSSISQRTGIVLIKASLYDVNGLRSAALFGDNRAASLFFPPTVVSPAGTLYLVWNASHSSLGSHTFTCTTFNAKAQRSTSTVTLNVTP